MKRKLYLSLYRKWFEEIVSGRKKEEYREAKPYWVKRLTNKTFDEIHFRNGYARNAPRIIVECKGIRREGNRFIISLGRLIA